MQRKNVTFIVIQGAYGAGNFGDDALMVAAHSIVSAAFPNARISLACRKADYIARFLPDVPVLSKEELVTLNPDLLVLGGGTQFFSFPKHKRSELAWQTLRRFALPLRWLREIFYELLMPRNRQVEALEAALGLGVGPFDDPVHERRIMRRLSSMKYLAVRDRRSNACCRKWGCEDVKFLSDLVFWPKFVAQYVPNQGGNASKNEIKKVGIVVRDWPYTKQGGAYSQALFEVSESIRAEGKDVRFILFSPCTDRQWAQCLQDRGEDVLVWRPSDQSITEFIDVLAEFDLFITARYHGAVFAAILGKPIICIEVEQKLRLVSELFESGARLWSYPFSPTDCMAALEEIEMNYELSRQQLNQIVGSQMSVAKQFAPSLSTSCLQDQSSD
ncbi:MAG: polysaccharide pyruvyl transferase family protein [Halioglobus sp.]